MAGPPRMQPGHGAFPQDLDWEAARSRCLREAGRILQSPHEAEDAVQEAMLRAWRARDRCRSADAPLAWLLQITRNEAYRLLARRPCDREVCLEAEEASVRLTVAFPEVEATVDLRAALDRLPTRDRAIVELHYIADIAASRIAHLAQAPEPTVRVKLHRARRRLRALVEAECLME